MSVAVNGRVLLRPPGGVHRYASEVTAHLDGCRVIAPRSARFPWSARLWEQTVLPARAWRSPLLNLAHGAPLLHPRSVVVVYDLFAVDEPDSVSPSFAALMRKQLPLVIRRAAAIATVSRATATRISERFAIPLDDIAVAPPGISAAFGPGSASEARARLGVDPERPLVSALLDATPRKRAPDTLAVLRQVCRARPEVSVVTAGRTEPAAFAGGARVAVGDAHRHFPEADDPTLADLWRASDVVVAMTPAEGFGLPQVEALACGAALVCRPVPSLTEHAPDAALLIDSIEGAVEAVVGLLDDRRAREVLTRNGPAAVGDLQWSRTAETLSRVLERMEG